MNKETIRKEFEEWAEQTGPYWNMELRIMYAAWLESARRTREECCETIRAKKVAIECAIEFEQAYNYAIDDAIQAIRATIPEE